MKLLYFTLVLHRLILIRAVLQQYHRSHYFLKLLQFSKIQCESSNMLLHFPFHLIAQQTYCFLLLCKRKQLIHIHVVHSQRHTASLTLLEHGTVCACLICHLSDTTGIHNRLTIGRMSTILITENYASNSVFFHNSVYKLCAYKYLYISLL